MDEEWIEQERTKIREARTTLGRLIAGGLEALGHDTRQLREATGCDNGALKELLDGLSTRPPLVDLCISALKIWNTKQPAGAGIDKAIIAIEQVAPIAKLPYPSSQHITPKNPRKPAAPRVPRPLKILHEEKAKPGQKIVLASVNVREIPAAKAAFGSLVSKAFEAADQTVNWWTGQLIQRDIQCSALDFQQIMKGGHNLSPAFVAAIVDIVQKNGIQADIFELQSTGERVAQVAAKNSRLR